MGVYMWEEAMASPVMLDGKKLSEFRVVDLRQELEKRGCEKSGVKAVLIERLQKVLLSESEAENKAGEETEKTEEPDLEEVNTSDSPQRKQTKKPVSRRSRGKAKTKESDDEDRDDNEASSGAEEEAADLDVPFTMEAEAADRNIEDVENVNEAMLADLVDSNQMPVDLEDLEFHVEDEVGIDEHDEEGDEEEESGDKENISHEVSQEDVAMTDSVAEAVDTGGCDEDSLNIATPVDNDMQDASLEQAETEHPAKDTLEADSASTGNNSLSVSLFVHTDDVQDDLDDDLKAVENGMDEGSEEKQSEETPEAGKVTEVEERKEVILDDEKSAESAQTENLEKEEKVEEEAETKKPVDAPETTEESESKTDVVE